MRLTPGQDFGAYRLLERVAGAGEGQVWRANQTSLGRDVALKVLPPKLAAQADFVERFRHEALALSRLHHPSVLAVLDFGEWEGCAFLVAPFVDGGPLTLLLGEPWPLPEALLVLEPLASALDYVHARRVVHRNLKPSNVLISDAGWVMITDFSLVAERAAQPLAGPEAVGSSQSPYLAPEQIAGRPARSASDRYAFGVVAFELLTGRPPFADELRPRTAEGYATTPSLRTTLPPPVEAALTRALSNDPNERFPTALTLVRALAASEASARAEASEVERDSTHRVPVPTAVAGPALSAPRSLSQPPEPTPVEMVSMLERCWRLRRQLAVGVLVAVVVGLLSGVWLVQPAMAQAAGRGFHAAAALTNGEVVVAGGCTNRASDDAVGSLVGLFRRVRGGAKADRWLASALRFTPGQAGWAQVGDLREARCELQLLTLPGDRALALGGRGPDQPPEQLIVSAERYHRSSDAWTPAGRLLVPRRDFSATVLANGQVLVVGGAGQDENAPLATVERYTPSTSTWSVIAGLNEGRRLHTATLLADGKVLVAGGTGALGAPLTTAERWDPASGVWTRVAPMRQARVGHTATLLPDGRVLVVGGTAERGRQALAESYDPSNDRWSLVPGPSGWRAGHTATLLADGQVMVLGGNGPSGVLASAERFDHAAGRWLAAASLSQPRVGHTATLLTDGRVLVVGGADPNATNEYLHTAELFDPATDSWLAISNLPP